MIAKCLKALPPTCKLLILNYGGKILFQKMGTSQQGSSSGISRSLRPSLSESSCCDRPETRPVRKSFSLPSPSTGLTETPDRLSSKSTSTQQLYESSPAFSYRCFTFEELNRATQSFGPHMLISEGAGCQVYRAILENGQAASVKVLKTSIYSEDAFFREVEILSVLKHENIVLLLGYCRCKQLRAIVHNLLNSSLEQRLHQLKWHERMQVALGVAKALNYLHSCRPPIIHKAVKLSNILLSEDFKPQLSGFGAANAHASASRSPARKKSTCVAGTIGYLAPEYIMYGKVDEKLDVYSYGVVLLELITGKDAFRTVSLSNGESFSLWARSLLDRDTYEHLIDPNLKGDYKKDEMKTMITAAQCCLLHSPTRRPTMKTILHFLEDPNCVDLSQMEKRR